MNCPFCRIPSMRAVKAGDCEVDRCTACGALWFDLGEIRELTEGRLPVEGEAAEPGGPGATGAGTTGAAAAPPAAKAGSGAAGRDRSVLQKMHRAAEGLSCPRCGGRFRAIDFQMTGVPVFLCLGCRGYLAPRRSAAAIDARFGFIRRHQGEYAALGEQMAEAVRRRMEGRPVAGMDASVSPSQIPLPILVPIDDNAPALQSFPVVTYALIALSAILYFYFRISGAALHLPGGIPGLPSGGGAGAVPASAILAAPFLHAGFVPLLAGALFLFVLGDNVEDRIGRIAFALFYLLCGAAGGVAHLALGKAGHPAALGSAGAVAGVLGAYLVFFPQVSITMYGLGRMTSLPAYLFACAWVVAAFLIGPGPLTNFINPAPLSLPGNIAGFGAGVLVAVCWRFFEEAPGG